MGMSDKFHVKTTLSPAKEPFVPIE